jgi:type VI secretion system protein ImpK
LNSTRYFDHDNTCQGFEGNPTPRGKSTWGTHGRPGGWKPCPERWHPRPAARHGAPGHHPFAALSASLDQRGVASDVREDALYAQCGLLDEAVLRHLSAKERPEWDARPLQVERDGRHDAGDRVFERLAERMREVSPNLDLLEYYSAILGLGFMGRYAREGEAKRSALIASLDAQLEKLRPARRQTLIADRTGRRLADWLYRLSPWAIAGLGCVAAVLVYLIWGHALDLQLANLLSSKP